MNFNTHIHATHTINKAGIRRRKKQYVCVLCRLITRSELGRKVRQFTQIRCCWIQIHCCWIPIHCHWIHCCWIWIHCHWIRICSCWIRGSESVVIFDILQCPAFNKYSICWVFRALCICVFVKSSNTNTMRVHVKSEYGSNTNKNQSSRVFGSGAFKPTTGFHSNVILHKCRCQKYLLFF